MNDRDLFAEKLYKARMKANLSQAELGRKAELDSTYISHIESGRWQPSIKNLKALCIALDISADWLLSIPKRGQKKKERE